MSRSIYLIKSAFCLARCPGCFCKPPSFRSKWWKLPILWQLNSFASLILFLFSLLWTSTLLWSLWPLLSYCLKHLLRNSTLTFCKRSTSYSVRWAYLFHPFFCCFLASSLLLSLPSLCCCIIITLHLRLSEAKHSSLSSSSSLHLYLSFTLSPLNSSPRSWKVTRPLPISIRCTRAFK